jgi:signal transduction histidine kinase
MFKNFINIKIINTGYYSVLGLFFFIFSQAYILSKKSSLALTRVEELTESLEKKVLQRTEELSKERDRLIGANLQIEKLSESRKRLSIIGQMASGIVHDIKNPMSTIKSFAELVRGGNLSNIEKEEYLSYISREIDRLSDMTYEILDFSKGNIQLFIQNEFISKILNEVYEFLKIDFPRVPYPKDAATFWQLVKLGGEIRQIHLLESSTVEKYITQYPEDGNNVVVKPKYEKGKVYINDTQYFDNVPQVAWDFFIGGYQPAQKWLKDRKERTLEFDDILHYQKIIVALTETDRLMNEINKIDIE